jgi:DNA-binding NarL/FixJ family response regulator
MSDQIAMVIRRIKPGLKVVSVRTIDDLNCAVISGGPPEIICTDLELPVSFGISGIKTLRKKFPNTRLAVITGSDPKPYETECLNAGADVFIPKTDPVSLVLEKMSALLVISDAAPEHDGDVAGAGPKKLSKRQKQLIVMLSQGLSNRDIADQIGISEYTVKVHFWRLFRRLAVSSRIQALHFARTNGWLSV